VLEPPIGCTLYSAPSTRPIVVRTRRCRRDRIVHSSILAFVDPDDWSINGSVSVVDEESCAQLNKHLERLANAVKSYSYNRRMRICARPRSKRQKNHRHRYRK